MRRLLARGLLALACSWAAVTIPVAPTRACEARIHLDPATPFAGEQVIHQIVLTGVNRASRIEWLVPPAFPDMRAVILPPVAESDTAGPNVRRARRAVWAARPGEIRLPEASYRCQPDGGTTGVFRTPPTTLQVRPIPERGRPPSWRGLVGATILAVHPGEPGALHVGEPLELLAVATGPGHMRRARIVWPLAELENQSVAAELFERAAIVSERSGSRMLGRITSVLDVVPHRPGELRVPPVTVAFFDPSSETFEQARSEAFSIEIRPERVQPPDPSPEGVWSDASMPGQSQRHPTAWGFGCLVLAVLAFVVVRTRRGTPPT